MIIRDLSRAFDPVYLKPKVVSRAIAQLGQSAIQRSPDIQTQLPRSSDERRQQDRRKKKVPVLLDLRSTQARRRNPGRRQIDLWNRHQTTAGHGIDVYA